MSISVDKYINFYIENFNNILSLKEIIEHAERNIPHIVIREVKRSILDSGIDCKFDYDGNGNIWWATEDIYDYSNEQGLYFLFEENFSSFFDGNDPQDSSYLCAYIDTVGIKQKYKKREYIDHWHNKFQKNIKLLSKHNIIIQLPIDYENPYLVKYPLHKEININNLMDKSNFRRSIQKSAKIFTEICLSIATT